MELPRYSVLIYWSDEDDAFLVTLPEWKDRLFGPVGHGSTYAEALEAGQIAIEHLVSIALETGQSLPLPQVPDIAA